MMNASLTGSFPAMFSWVLKASWQASLLALLVLVAQWTLRGSLTARARCLLWGAVVLRLLVPPLPQARWTLFPTLQPRQAAAVAIREADPIAIIPTGQPQTDIPLPTAKIDPALVASLRAELAAMPDPEVVATPPIASSPAPISHPVRDAERWTWPKFTTMLLAAWVIGMMFFAVRLLLASTRLIRSIRRCRPLNDSALESLAHASAAEAGLHHAPPILAADHLPGPAVTGFFKPKLLLPPELLATFSPAELRLMLLHEFGHLRRRDLQLSWLLSFLAAIHWFNPLLRRALDRLRADCELACDEFVLKLTSPAAPDGQRHTYGHALLRVAERLTQRPHSAAPVALGQIGILDGPRHLHRRILMIAQFNPASRTFSRTLPVLFAGGVLLCAGALLADAADPTKPKAAEQPTKLDPPSKETLDPPTTPTATDQALTKQGDGAGDVLVLGIPLSPAEAQDRRLSELLQQRSAIDNNRKAALAKLDAVRKSLKAENDPLIVVQLVEQSKKLAEAKDQLEKARRQYEAAKSSEEDDAQKRLDLATQKVKDVETEVRVKSRREMLEIFTQQAASFELQLATLNTRIASLREEQAQGSESAVGLASQKRVALTAMLDRTLRDLDELKQKFPDHHPEIVARTERLEQIKRQLGDLDLQFKGLSGVSSTPMAITVERPIVKGPTPESEMAALDVSAAQARLQASGANLNFKVKTLARVKSLRDAGQISADEFEKAESEAATAKANVAVEEVQVRQAEIRQSGAAAQRSDPSRGGGPAMGSLQGMAGAMGTASSAGMGRLPGMGGSVGMSVAPHAMLPILTDVQDAAARAIDSATAQKLHQPQVVDFNPLPAQDAIRAIAAKAGLDLLFDDRELQNAHVDLHTPVTLRIKQPTSGEQLLRWVLRDIPGAGFTIDHGVLLIAEAGKVERMTTTRAYDTAALNGAVNSLPELISEVISPSSWREQGGPGVARIFGSTLLVTQTAANHTEVEKLLTLLAGKGARGQTPALPSPAAAIDVFAQARGQAAFSVSANNMRQILIGIHMFAGEHEGKLPTSLHDDLKPYLGGQDEAIYTNPRAPGRKDGYTYVHPADRISDLKDASKTVLLREAIDNAGDGILIGYADGHVEKRNDKLDDFKR